MNGILAMSAKFRAKENEQTILESAQVAVTYDEENG
jgi:hypothetical protein